MAKFDPILSLDCTRVEGVGAQPKERKGSNFAAQRSRATVLEARRAKHIHSKNLAIAIWQPCLPVARLGEAARAQHVVDLCADAVLHLGLPHHVQEGEGEDRGGGLSAGDELQRGKYRVTN